MFLANKKIHMCKYIFINLLEHHLRLYLSHIIKYVAKQINNHVFLSSKKKKNPCICCILF